MPEMAEQNECDAPDTVVPAGAINTGEINCKRLISIQRNP
jgi:hypothetical protein